MRRKFMLMMVLMLGVGFLASVVPSFAAEPAFAGKTIRIIVGFSPGGGFDVTARIIANYLGKHIPGNPTIIVDNMPGASGLIAANHTYSRAKPDGLTIGFFHGSLIMQQLLGEQGIAWDARKFEYVGAMCVSTIVCAFGKKSGINSMEKWMASRTPVKIGGIAPGSAPSDAPRILEMAIGVPLKLVEGHKGIPEIRLAVERGDVAGICGPWDTIKDPWKKALEVGDVVVVLQVASKKNADLPTTPLATSFAKSEEARQLVKVGLLDPAKILRIFALPPGTPKEIVQILRKGFMDTMNDPDFLPVAKKALAEVDPLPGDEAQETVTELFKTPPELVTKLKQIMIPKK